jgi:hypothetical protein
VARMLSFALATLFVAMAVAALFVCAAGVARI